MKRIELRNVVFAGVVDAKGNPAPFSYRQQIEELMRTPIDPRSGADVAEVRRSIRVLDALEHEQEGALVLEDADYEHLKKRVLATRWPIVDKAVLQFIEDVTGLP